MKWKTLEQTASIAVHYAQPKRSCQNEFHGLLKILPSQADPASVYLGMSSIPVIFSLARFYFTLPIFLVRVIVRDDLPRVSIIFARGNEFNP
jgi:hypothetical protein